MSPFERERARADAASEALLKVLGVLLGPDEDETRNTALFAAEEVLRTYRHGGVRRDIDDVMDELRVKARLVTELERLRIVCSK